MALTGRMRQSELSAWRLDMPIRGVKNPFPKVMPPTNGGMFSGRGSQKMDPVKQSAIVKKTVAEAMRTDQKIGKR
jgi:hypothetical protein